MHIDVMKVSRYALTGTESCLCACESTCTHEAMQKLKLWCMFTSCLLPTCACVCNWTETDRQYMHTLVEAHPEHSYRKLTFFIKLMGTEVALRLEHRDQVA